MYILVAPRGFTYRLSDTMFIADSLATSRHRVKNKPMTCTDAQFIKVSPVSNHFINIVLAVSNKHIHFYLPENDTI